MAGSVVVKELATGIVDGVNDVFQSSRDYRTDCPVVGYVNGQALPGKTVTLGGKSFQITKKLVVGDVIAVAYSTLS